VDNEGAQSAQIPVAAVVAAVNNPPEALVTSSTLTPNVARNVSGGRTITYQNIFDAIDFREYDFDTANKPNLNDAHGIRFRIESVESGVLRATNNTGTQISYVPGNASSMKFLVKAGADNTTSWTQLNWTPPTTGVGEFTIMKVRLFDGVDYSSSVVSIKINVDAGNTAPTASAFTVSPGIAENGALLLSYNDLLVKSSASDAENDPVYFKISFLLSGSIKYKGTTYSSAGALALTNFGPGDTLVWSPAANVNDPAVAAFKITPTDLANDGSEVTVSVNVTSVNTPPTHLSSYTYLNQTRYPNVKFVEMSHAGLLTNLAVADVEDTNLSTSIKFRIEELLAGQGVYIQNTGSCGTVPANTSFYPAVNLLETGKSLCWIQPSGVIGTYSALKLSVLDSNSALSAAPATVSVQISQGTDATPAYFGTYVTPTYKVVKGGGSITWTYEELKALSGAYDTDTSAISLVITSISNTLVGATAGTLQKNAANVSAWGGTLGQAYSSNVPTSAMVIVPGESITFSSMSSSTVATGVNTELFRFAALDSYSSAATDKAINVTLVANTGENPNFGYVAPIPVGSKTNAVLNQIPYTQFRTYADANDIDEPSSEKVKFVIKSVTTTNGSVQISKGGAACSAITTNTTEFVPGDFICYTPNSTGAALATDAIHTIMTVRAKNVPGNAEVGSTIDVPVRMP
jgi:hypothetical protein